METNSPKKQRWNVLTGFWNRVDGVDEMGWIDNDAGKDQNPRMARRGHCSINLKYK